MNYVTTSTMYGAPDLTNSKDKMLHHHIHKVGRYAKKLKVIVYRQIFHNDTTEMIRILSIEIWKYSFFIFIHTLILKFIDFYLSHLM